MLIQSDDFYPGIPEVVDPIRQSSRMRVVHLSTYDVAGGAARAAHRLHIGLNRLGCDSTMFVRESSSDDPKIVQSEPPRRSLFKRVHHHVRGLRIDHDFSRHRPTRPRGYDRFSDDRAPHSSDWRTQLPASDVINLHWIAGFVDYRHFFASISKQTPVVWTLHDMNAFTGGCHYNLGCTRYTQTCGACPQLGSSHAKDLAYQIWQRKQKIFSGLGLQRLHIAVPSRWLADEVRRSALASHFSVSVIPYGIDVENFAPRDRQTARDVFGISRRAKVVLFVADGGSLRRKGFVYLAQALKSLQDAGTVTLLCLGRGLDSAEFDIPSVNLGFIQNDRLLSFAYSAADLLVIPSLQDNLPNTVLEALACGTPVVGFDVGGIPDMVRPGITGLLAPPTDVVALREAIADLLRSPAKRAEMGAACRRVAVEEYTLEIQARRYLELYQATLQHESPNLSSGPKTSPYPSLSESALPPDRRTA